MKQQWYTKKVQVTDKLYFQLQPEEQSVNIYVDHQLLETFALNRKIYTFFKRIQDILQSPNYLTIANGLGDLYSGEIHLDATVMMQVTNIHGYLTLDFYHKKADGNELLYLMPLTYTAGTLFKNMLIPYHLLKDPNYRIRHVFKFLDMMQILKLKELERG